MGTFCHPRTLSFLLLSQTAHSISDWLHSHWLQNPRKRATAWFSFLYILFFKRFRGVVHIPFSLTTQKLLITSHWYPRTDMHAQFWSAWSLFRYFPLALLKSYRTVTLYFANEYKYIGRWELDILPVHLFVRKYKRPLVAIKFYSR